MAAVTPVLPALRLAVASVPPPRAGSFAWVGDHGVDEHKQCDGDLLADEGRGEAAQGLGNDHHAPWLAIAYCLNNGGCVLRQTGLVVVGRERDRDGLVPVLLELRRNEVPVPRAAACARYENEAQACRRSNPFDALRWITRRGGSPFVRVWRAMRSYLLN